MDESFQNYCIVCDRLIAPPPPSPADLKELNGGGKKRAAAGAIRIKNRDGTTTIRTANGVKTTTRPPLRTAPRLQTATGTTTNNAKIAGPKALAPSATQPPALTTSLSSSGSGDNLLSPSPKIEAVTPPPPEPFVSSIYCTRECADKDAGSSTANATDLGRALGVGFTYSDALVAAGLHVSPGVAPPSPLLGSDTDSSNGIRGVPRTPDAIGGGSIPKGLEFFRLARDSPDDAWRESRTVRPQLDAAVVQQQMSRQRSSGPHSASGTSSDSLASLWAGDHDSNTRRSSSNVGSLCVMTPMHAPTPDSAAGSARRSMSSSSDGSGAQRPALTRSTFSHTSLGGLNSPALGACQEVGSAPSHTAYLMQAYASAFPARDGGAMSPPLMSGSATPDSRSTSVAIAPVPQRSASGTIRVMRNRTGSTGAATWDSFGKAEIRDRARRNTGCSESDFAVGSLPQSPDPERRGRHNSHTELYPKHSFEIEHGGWQIRYMKPEQQQQRQQRRNASRSRSRSRDPSSRYSASSPVPAPSTALPLPIPVRARPGPSTLASSNSTARSRTPQTNGTPLASRGASLIGFSPAGSRYGSSAALPDIAALHIAAAASSLSQAATALSAATATAATATSAAASTPFSASPRLSGSIPRPGFDWDTRTEHRTYELPKGVVQNPNKGLFYFNV